MKIWRAERSTRAQVRFLSSATSSTAGHAAGLFFPLDLALNLRAESYSPWILERLEWAGGNLESFQQGSTAIHKTLELEITPQGLCALTEKLGRERAIQRDADVAAFQSGELQARHVEAPPVAMAMLDGGMAQVRASEAAPGVHEPAWTETKVANISTYTDVHFEEDPQPEPPEKFLDPPKVAKLIQQMKGSSGAARAKGKRQRVKPEAPEAPEPAHERTSPKRKLRTVVATTKSCDEFGPMVAAEVMRRGFFGAKKKGAVGDGSLWIWGIVAMYLVGFTPILDFVHLLVHLYAAAQAAHKDSSGKAWSLYVELLNLGWKGKVTKLLDLLKKHAQRLGEPPEDCAEDDPRKIVARVIHYVDTNKDKMDYPRYRREGLPISSAPMESLIKQVSRRVKGTEKFWIRDGLEAVLQVRAAHLSEDDRVEAHWAKRPLGRAAGRSLFRRAAAA